MRRTNYFGRLDGDPTWTVRFSPVASTFPHNFHTEQNVEREFAVDLLNLLALPRGLEPLFSP